MLSPERQTHLKQLEAVGLVVDEGQIGYMLRKYDDDRGAELPVGADQPAQLQAHPTDPGHRQRVRRSVLRPV